MKDSVLINVSVEFCPLRTRVVPRAAIWAAASSRGSVQKGRISGPTQALLTQTLPFVEIRSGFANNRAREYR